jgi:hypothetical protein
MTAGAALSIWTPDAERRALTLRRDPMLARQIAIHPNGNIVAAGQFDSQIILWQAPLLGVD